MRKFELPEIEIVQVDIPDIITSSVAFQYEADEMVGWE